MMTITMASSTRLKWNAYQTHSTPQTCQMTSTVMASVTHLTLIWTAMVCSTMWKLTLDSTTTPATLERTPRTLTPMVMASVMDQPLLQVVFVHQDLMPSHMMQRRQWIQMVTVCLMGSTVNQPATPHSLRILMMTTTRGLMKRKPCAVPVLLTPWTALLTPMVMAPVMPWMM